ncbi:MAG: hypothetical protein H0U53_08785, partial [Actinobacteria bacterium]|nr:hypothetical protein [Actinomycetota bacterium]
MRRLRLLLVAVLILSPIGVTSGASARASDNGKILVSRDLYELGTLRPDGNGYRELLRAENEPWKLQWSPDKTRFAIGEEETLLYIVDPQTGERDELPVDLLGDFDWSPDGRLIAYIGITSSDLILGGCLGIRIIDVRSHADRALTDGPDCTGTDVEWSPT